MARIGDLEGHILNAAAPVHVFVLRALLFPAIAVIDLGACAFTHSQSFSGRYFLLATLAFLLTSLILDRADVHAVRSISLWPSEFLEIVARWLLIAGLSYGLIELAGLSRLIGYPVLLAWIVSTPFMMWLAQSAIRAALCESFSRAEPQRAIIVGVTEVGKRLEDTIAKLPVLRTRVMGYFEDRSIERL
jgi:putative colanic acid biosynthesis UDP-glucose lipid carrier transferase